MPILKIYNFLNLFRFVSKDRGPLIHTIHLGKFNSVSAGFLAPPPVDASYVQ
jgi:hypothetical protein